MDPTQDFLDALVGYLDTRQDAIEAERLTDYDGAGNISDFHKRRLGKAREKVRQALGKAVLDALAQRKIDEADHE